MSLIDNFIIISDPKELQTYISDRMEEIHDYFNSDYQVLISIKSKIRSYIQLNSALLNLDLSNPINIAFIELLLNYCERFSLPAAFQTLFNILTTTTAIIGKRLKAASLFLTNINQYDEFLKNYDEIVQLLDYAAENEEDKIINVVITFINYYTKVIIDCSNRLDIVEELRGKIKNSIESENFLFMEHELFITVYALDYSNRSGIINDVQKLIEEQIIRQQTLTLISSTSLVMEENTEYISILNNTNKQFDAIRAISISKSSEIINPSRVRSSLDRGTCILHNQQQMYLYMRNFGNMHKAKLVSAFQFLPQSFYNKRVDIIDWACGQAVATMVYIDFIKEKRFNQQINSITLIEPSELSLKRAAAHVKRVSNLDSIRTINKTFDSLVAEDIRTIRRNVKLHLFSSILDVDDFSMAQLIKLITSTQNCENYFVCSSPSINDIKNDRILSFMRYFERNYKSFEMLGSEINTAQGEYWNCNHHYRYNSLHNYHSRNGCDNKWTKVVVVFKVAI